MEIEKKRRKRKNEKKKLKIQIAFSLWRSFSFFYLIQFISRNLSLAPQQKIHSLAIEIDAIGSESFWLRRSSSSSIELWRFLCAALKTYSHCRPFSWPRSNDTPQQTTFHRNTCNSILFVTIILISARIVCICLDA